MSIKLIMSTIVIIVISVTIVMPIINETITTDEETLDIIVVDGQSNGQYWGWNTNNICNKNLMIQSWNETPKHNLYYYGTDVPITYGPVFSNKTYDDTLDSYDIHSMYDNGWLIGGYEPGLAYYHSEKSKHDTLVINVAVGAANIQWLSPTGIGGKFAVDVIDNALSKIEGYSNIQFVGMVWAQGEGNQLTNVNTYMNYFENIMKMYSKYGLNDFYIIETKSDVGGNSIIAQRELAEKYDNVTIATDIVNTFTVDNGLMMPDNLHYNQTGRSMIAEIVGNEIGYTNYFSNELTKSILAIVPVLLIALSIIAICKTAIAREK